MSNVAATILLPCFNLQQLVSLKEHCEVYANEHENVSSDVDSVRSKNLHNFNNLVFFFEGSTSEPVEYTLPSIWNKYIF